jgi:hypothetical protein
VHNYQPEYFNAETGKTLYWQAKQNTSAYAPPYDHKQYPIPGSMVTAGNCIKYDDLKYGYSERDFNLIEI